MALIECNKYTVILRRNEEQEGEIYPALCDICAASSLDAAEIAIRWIRNEAVQCGDMQQWELDKYMDDITLVVYCSDTYLEDIEV